MWITFCSLHPFPPSLYRRRPTSWPHLTWAILGSICGQIYLSTLIFPYGKKSSSTVLNYSLASWFFLYKYQIIVPYFFLSPLGDVDGETSKPRRIQLPIATSSSGKRGKENQDQEEEEAEEEENMEVRGKFHLFCLHILQ